MRGERGRAQIKARKMLRVGLYLKARKKAFGSEWRCSFSEFLGDRHHPFQATKAWGRKHLTKKEIFVGGVGDRYRRPVVLTYVSGRKKNQQHTKGGGKKINTERHWGGRQKKGPTTEIGGKITKGVLIPPTTAEGGIIYLETHSEGRQKSPNAREQGTPSLVQGKREGGANSTRSSLASYLITEEK